MRARALATRLLLLGVSVAATLLAVELALRWIAPSPRLVIEPAGLYLEDPPGHRLAPGYRGRIYNGTEYSIDVRVNRDGLRGPELPPASGGSLRLLAIGDSFTFGVGVEDDETFVAVAAERLAELGRPAVALNGGIPDAGVQDAVAWLERHGAALSPDAVVLAIFLGNDLGDAAPGRVRTRIVDGLPVPAASPRGPKAWLHRRSHLYRLAKGVLDSPALLPLRERLGLAEPWAVATLRGEFEVYRRAADLAASEAVLDDALGRLDDFGRGRGLLVVAMLVPNDLEVDPERWRLALEQLGLDPEAYDPSIPRRLFARLLERHQIPTLDSAPAIRDAMERGETLYYRHDRHWTARAHQLAGAELARFLAGRLP